MAAAALAAGLITSKAQVYSQNVVGYITITNAANQFALLSNPLDNGTNNLTSLFPSAPNGTQVQVWTGTGFQGAQKSFGNWNTNLTISVGEGFFIKFPSAQTNTFVGDIPVSVGATNTVALPAATFALVGSTIPYTDNLTGTNLDLQLANGSQVQVWNGIAFQGAQKSFGNWNTNLLIQPGEGFFVKSATSTNWSQVFNP